MILRDFECINVTCRKIFERLVESRETDCMCSKCGCNAVKILTFHGLIKAAPDSDLPPVLARDSGLTREVSPGKPLDRPWEEEREHSKVRWVEKKLPDGRTVRRPSIKIDEPKSRGLHSNLEMDIKRDAVKRKK